ncbi:MAG: AAA family ATPase [Chloroflexi bacterium]|nr:AAA family ATPase [Chloroflexota bacterium]
MQRKLVVITGSSGVGKSTLARALQEALLPDQWLHFSVDSLFYCLPRSVTLRVDQQNDWSLVDSRAIVSAAYACTRTLLDLGHRVIFDAVILAENGAKEMLRAFDGLDPLLVELSCSWDEIERRTLARGNRTLAEAKHGYRNASGHLKADHAFDSSTTSAEQIAAQLAARMRGGGIAA